MSYCYYFYACIIFMILIFDYGFHVVVHMIEFQKRGLSHVHILMFLRSKYKISLISDIDKVICVEILKKYEHLRLYEVIKNIMIHRPCDLTNPKSPCMKN